MTTLRFDTHGQGDVRRADVETLLRTRLLIQANSGGGKSHALRALLEQTHGRVLQLVLDPEGEFATLREQYGFVLAGAEGDVPAHPKVARVLCRRLLEANASAVIDLYDLSLSDRREFVRLFLTELMALPRALWRPTLIVLDESHLFCPERGSGEAQSTDAVITLCTQGRKRGFCAVLATQRISKLHKDAAAELLNKMIGRTGLDVDIKRAGDELGMDRDARMALRDLAPGEFFTYGPALGGRIARVRSADVVTRHPDANGPSTLSAPASASVQALVAQLGDLPALAAAEAQTTATLEARVRELEAQLRQAARVSAPDVAVVTAAVAQARREVQVSAAATLEALRPPLDAALAALQELARGIASAGAGVSQQSGFVADNAPIVSPAPGFVAHKAPIVASHRPIISPSDAAAVLSRTQRRMLSVLVALADLGVEWPERRTMAGWAGVSHTTGTFSNQLRGMRDAGCVEVQGDRLRVTDRGRALADPDRPAITSLADLHAVWASKFSATVRRLFEAMLTLSGPTMRPVAKATLAQHIGVSHTTGTFSNQLRELRTPGVIEDVDRAHLRLTPLVYPDGLS